MTGPPRHRSGVCALTAVIVNWRTPELARRAAQALIADGVPPQRLIVVDNGSGDGSLERLRSALPAGTKLVGLAANLGFARANNRAAKTLPAQSAYLFVNSDAFAQPGAVTALVQALEDPRVGVAVPRLLNPDGTLQESVHPRSTPLPEAIRAAGLSRLVPNPLRPRLGAHWDHATSRPIQAAIGAVMLVRAETWAQLDGFDERSLLYAEDLDLFWRLAAIGQQARFVAGAAFIHVGGASSVQRFSEPDRARVKASAEAAMLRRHLRPWRAALTLWLMAGGTAARAAASALRGDRAGAESYAALARGYLAVPAAETPVVGR